MKMKNMLIGGMSLALVACISIGATLAALTATGGAVKNTFHFATGEGGADAIQVRLTELDPNGLDKYGNEIFEENADEDGWIYRNLVPGQDVSKEPQVSVNTKVDAYVYVRVTTGTNMTIKNDDGFALDEWTPITDASLQDNVKVYAKPVAANTTWSTPESLFTTATVGGTTGKEELGEIKIEVAAVQQAGFTNAQDAYTKAGISNVFQG